MKVKDAIAKIIKDNYVPMRKYEIVAGFNFRFGGVPLHMKELNFALKQLIEENKILKTTKGIVYLTESNKKLRKPMAKGLVIGVKP